MEPDVSQPIAWNVDAIVAALNVPPENFPEDALRAARANREMIIPRLIQVLDSATEETLGGRPVQGDAHLFALFLLGEFRAQEALPAIRRILSLPGDGTYDLFEDTLDEHAPGILAVLMRDDPFQIDDILGNREVDSYIRWMLAKTYLYFVRDGVVTRDAAVAHLLEQLRAATVHSDEEFAGFLVSELIDYGPVEARAEIEEAVLRFEIYDTRLFAPEHLEAAFRAGPDAARRACADLPPSGIVDAIETLRPWFEPRESRFARPSSYEPEDSYVDDEDLDLYASDPSITIHNSERKIGRNEPCPCGSGKKYKKCCGAA